MTQLIQAQMAKYNCAGNVQTVSILNEKEGKTPDQLPVWCYALITPEKEPSSPHLSSPPFFIVNMGENNDYKKAIFPSFGAFPQF